MSNQRMQREPSKGKPAFFFVLYDPSEYPLAAGTKMSRAEIEFGLVHKSLLPGTRLKSGGRVYQVVETPENHPDTRKIHYRLVDLNS